MTLKESRYPSFTPARIPAARLAALRRLGDEMRAPLQLLGGCAALLDSGEPRAIGEFTVEYLLQIVVAAGWLHRSACELLAQRGDDADPAWQPSAFLETVRSWALTAD